MEVAGITSADVTGGTPTNMGSLQRKIRSSGSGQIGTGSKPEDRVSYSMLTPTDEDLQKIEDMALQMGIMKKPVKMSDLIDREFIPKTIEPAEIKVAAK